MTGAGRLCLVQFEGPLQPQWRETVQGLGVDLLTYVPEDAFIASLDPPVRAQLRRLEFVRWVGPYQRQHKVEDRLRTAASQAAVSGEAIDVSVLLAPRARSTEVAAVQGLLISAGNETRLPQGTILRGRMPASRLEQLSDSDAVLWIESTPRMELFDEEAAKIVGGDDGLRGTPTLTQQLGYDGSGVVVAVADTGLDTGNPATMHPDLAGRVGALLQYGSLSNPSDPHGHGTHVAGIIAGNAAVGETDANGALYGLGVAPGAQIVAQRIFDGQGVYQAPPSFEALTRDAIAAGADIGNNSWGSDNQGRYDLTAMEFDALVRDADSLTPGAQPYILEFSAGNAGPVPQSVGTPAVAKNVITSGASQNNRFDFFLYPDGQEAMADFSSRGPCEDGRIKPDVVAPGTWIASLLSQYSNGDTAWGEISPHYAYQGGTSQAGPQVSGAAAVFVQFHRALHAGMTPSPALVKAALINASVDMDDGSGTTAVPNPDEGWGRVDLTRIIGSPRTNIWMDQTNLLGTGGSFETVIVVEQSSEPLRITLAYTDVPGFPGAIPALINDLDLEVTGPNGSLYRGNRFHNGESIPDPSSGDRINNVEGVHLPVPQPGEYRVRVLGHNVVDDARTDTGPVDQDFALAISGRLLPAGKSLIYLDRTAYTAPDRILVGVIDRDQAGAASVAGLLASDTEPGGEPLTLLAAGAGLFTNAIVTVTGPATGDGQLQVAHGDAINATYFDTSAGVQREASAQADLVPPQISGVANDSLFGQPGITWATDEPASSRVEYGTNQGALNLTASTPGQTSSHSVPLKNLVSGATYHYRVISADTAGNTATNDNAGNLFTLVAPDTLPVLLVDAYYPGFYDDFFFPPPPIANYTQPLDQLGVQYDLWDHASEGSPSLEVLSSYRVVIWRVPELNFAGLDPYPSFTPAEQVAIAEYLDQGGGFFLASMEVLTRLEEVGAESFRSSVLKVAGILETDATAQSVTGISGDPVSDGLSITLDYLDYYFADFSDTFTPTAEAAPIFLEDVSGDVVGLRYPGPGVQAPGRLVFLSFPFDAIPIAGPNNRAEVLRRVLQFLSPGITGEAVVSTDRSAYSLPAVVTVEVGDADLVGAGSVTITALSTTEPGGKSFVLEEVGQSGLFRGPIPLVHGTNSPTIQQLRAVEGDLLTFRFFDISLSDHVSASATVDVTPPMIGVVSGEPGYSTATISWTTDEPCDALVQYGESLPLPVNRTEFDPRLQTSHEVTLRGLAPGRPYFFQVVSRDAAGNRTVDNNGGVYYSFTTLTPVVPPLTDSFDPPTENWSVFTEEYSESGWTLGVPDNGVQTAAHSPPNVWGSILNGGTPSLMETFLLSPAIQLTGGSRATLRFWHSYEFTHPTAFDVLAGGQVLLVEDDTGATTSLRVWQDNHPAWEQVTIDLTPYAGKVIYLVWHHQLFSFDYVSRGGWLVDDVEILVETGNTGLLTVSNNLSQASFVLAGPATYNGVGKELIISNAPAGQYIVTFHPVPYHATPPSQTNTLADGGLLAFTAAYTFPDSNTNGISDEWEQAMLGGIVPTHPGDTDTDLDGANDFEEFVAGTNPTNAASHLGASLSLQPNGWLRLQWPTSAGRSYLLEEQTSNTADWEPVGEWTRASGASMARLLARPPVATLYRVQVRP